MLQLLINALRMRPDRIILGEVRRGEDARVLFEAMHTGHSVYATVHANSINETIHRLVNPPISVPSSLMDAVNLNVVMFRDRRLGIRRVYQVGEWVRSGDDEQSVVKPNILYRWAALDDTIAPYGRSLTLMEELSKHTSFTAKEVEEDIAKKKMIIDWLVAHDVMGIKTIGSILEIYYTNPDRVYAAAQKNTNPRALLE